MSNFYWLEVPDHRDQFTGYELSKAEQIENRHTHVLKRLGD